MALLVHVTLISGKSVSLEADLDDPVASLKRRAERAFGVGKGRLFNSSGSVLDGDGTLGRAGLQTGDSLTVQVSKVQICGGLSQYFAAILGDGSVVTWGSRRRVGGRCLAGHSTDVQAQPTNVQRIQATDEAFAAILGDGSVVTRETQTLAETLALCKTS